MHYQSDLKIEKRSNLEYKKNQASSARNRNNLNLKTKNPASQNQNTLNFIENTCKQLNIVSWFQAWWPVPGSRYRERERRGGNGAGEEGDNFFAVFVLFLFVSTKWKPVTGYRGDNLLRASVRQFCFCSRWSPDLSFCPFEKGGKRDTYRD